MMVPPKVVGSTAMGGGFCLRRLEVAFSGAMWTWIVVL